MIKSGWKERTGWERGGKRGKEGGVEGDQVSVAEGRIKLKSQVEGASLGLATELQQGWGRCQDAMGMTLDQSPSSGEYGS